MLIQSVVILLSSLVFLMINNNSDFISSLYGGLISLINNYLIIRISNKQEKIKIHNAGIGLRIMVVSVVSRLLLVAMMVLIGFKLEFNAFALLFGLSVGQVALVIDKLKNKG